MRDCCCPIRFMCEHYLTFSESLLGLILCLIELKQLRRNLNPKGTGGGGGLHPVGFFADDF